MILFTFLQLMRANIRAQANAVLDKSENLQMTCAARHNGDSASNEPRKN